MKKKSMNFKVKFLVLFLILTQILTACTSLTPQPTPTATIVPTPTTDPLSSAKIVKAFWDALETGDLETAMTYVGDEITCAGFCHFTGKEIFRSYLQGYLDAGHVTKIGDLKAIGSIVTYSWEVSRNGLFLRRGDTEMMQVEDGKIIYWENNHR
jgi:limonene-1,2-epoxide hydrolase